MIFSRVQYSCCNFLQRDAIAGHLSTPCVSHFAFAWGVRHICCYYFGGISFTLIGFSAILLVFRVIFCFLWSHSACAFVWFREMFRDFVRFRVILCALCSLFYFVWFQFPWISCNFTPFCLVCFISWYFEWFSVKCRDVVIYDIVVISCDFVWYRVVSFDSFVWFFGDLVWLVVFLCVVVISWDFELLCAILSEFMWLVWFCWDVLGFVGILMGSC